MSSMDGIIIQDDGETTTIIIGAKLEKDPIKPQPKKPHIERRDRCPRCEGKTLIDTELGGQVCTICGWPDKEDARERSKLRKKALMTEKTKEEHDS